MVLGFCLGFFQNFLTTVAILLEAGAFVNMKQSSGETALMKVSSVFVLTWFNSKYFWQTSKTSEHICRVSLGNMYYI